MKIKFGRKARGFTLIEVLLVIGIIAVLAGVVLVAINPSRQFAQARNTQRFSNVNAILNAVDQNMADNRGIFTCGAGALPTTSPLMMKNSGGYDIAPCIVPTYIAAMPFDPGATGAFYTSTSSYDTAYEIYQDQATKRVVVSVPSANQELAQVISVTR